MLNLMPVRALYYNQEKITSLSSVVTPLYDDIEPAAQSRYYAENPVNAIRLEMGLTFPTDDVQHSRYSRAAQYLDKWLIDETILLTEKPWFFIYQQEFVWQDHPGVKTGLVCGLQHDALASHPQVPISSQREEDVLDRLEILRSTGSCFGTPLLGYRDPGGNIGQRLLAFIQGRFPDIQFIDEFRVLNKVWSVKASQDLSALEALLSNSSLYILAGGELLRASQQYCSEAGHNLMPVTLVSAESDHLVPMPWHRAIQLNISMKSILDSLAETYTLTDIGSIGDLGAFYHMVGSQMGSAPPMCLIGEDRLILAAEKQVPAGLLYPDAGRLMVALAANQANSSDSAGAFFSRRVEHILQQVQKGKNTLGIILPPPASANLMTQADAGITVPDNTIWWHPRQLAGVLMANFALLE